MKFSYNERFVKGKKIKDNKTEFGNITTYEDDKIKRNFYTEKYKIKVKNKGSKKVNTDKKIEFFISQIDKKCKRKLTTNEQRKLKKLQRQVFVFKTKGIEHLTMFYNKINII